MVRFILRRILILIPVLFAISLVCFLIIELPPGDYLTAYRAQLASRGDTVDADVLAALEKQYGLDRPVYERYVQWVWNVLHGDFGQSFGWGRPVKELIWERLALTVVITFTTLMFTWIVGFFVGIYSATHQYSAGDYLFTGMSFVGVGIPDFLIALVLMWVAYSSFGMDVGGLFSNEYQSAPWSLAKVWDMVKHMWVPLVILGLGGTASMIRIMRANLLDELSRPYVVTARAKGLSERTLLRRYPVRLALNPFVSTAGWSLPGLISGATIVSVVLGLPTAGPILLNALMVQDMYLAATFVLLLSVLTIIGTLISDIALAFLDPRIRYTAA
ncbi:MAG: ABC transporter permease [Anaerolineae bacterium]